MIYIFNREALEERFGCWPSFHDAGVQAVRLESGQRADGEPSVELDIHLFDVDGVLADGRLNFVRHTLAVLRFDGVEAIVLQGFGPQNVLDELVLEDLGSKAPDAAHLLVSLPSNNGLGGSFRCEHTIVLSVSKFVPGRTPCTTDLRHRYRAAHHTALPARHAREHGGSREAGEH